MAAPFLLNLYFVRFLFVLRLITIIAVMVIYVNQIFYPLNPKSQYWATPVLGEAVV